MYNKYFKNSETIIMKVCEEGDFVQAEWRCFCLRSKTVLTKLQLTLVFNCKCKLLLCYTSPHLYLDHLC